jgi:hypothetical protein
MCVSVILESFIRHDWSSQRFCPSIPSHPDHESLISITLNGLCGQREKRLLNGQCNGGFVEKSATNGNQIEYLLAPH